ncbi:MAG: DUF1592 domain-containing protein [Myxococcota bacterium]|nr:DUF1592 domain-containing protein [Myxococcota bacterium]
MRATAVAALVTLGIASGCVGFVEDGPAGPGGAPPRTPSPEPGACVPGDHDEAGLSRLTREQYDRTVSTLLGDSTAPARAFTGDDDLDGVRVGGALSPLAADELHTAAERLADAADVAAMIACDPTTDEEACARETVAAVGLRAYRRPLPDDELAGLLDVFRAGREGATFDDGVRWALSAMLVSPAFLYHAYGPLASAAPGEPLYGYAIASRLSYFFWGSMPDDALFEAAAAGELDTRDGVGAHARRMLEDARARETVRTFFSDWLHIDRIESVRKDETLFPEMTPELAHDLAQSMTLFVDRAAWESGFTDLLTSDEVFVNERIATAYGLGGITGDELRPVVLDPGSRAGLLTQPGLLAVLATHEQTHPILRGHFIRERLLCQDLPAPPSSVVVEVPAVDPESSTRERFTMHATEACAGCHELMDPMGFALERFDAMGRLRETDHGHAVDATGWVCDDWGCLERTEVDGAVELASHLASIDTSRDCVTREVVRFALHASPTVIDDCEVQRLSQELERTDDLQQLLVAIATSDSFARVGAPEEE